MKRFTLIALLLISAVQLSAQQLDTNFFPEFTPYAQNPIIDWNDFIIGSWADPLLF
jgi:hypothetical protein